uniref:Actin-related protein 2/3 complex subunit n=1 Tax=Sycon ciliatum TaxID=27933 RepID=M1XMP8_9METZ|nr:Actin-related protein Arp2/3 complex, subunit ARPC [Sycon ciliatum]|eukprot:scpid35900/ scgid2519/ Actin-related protein 2/3 complex subunit 1A; SOP2-like protein; Sid 329
MAGRDKETINLVDSVAVTCHVFNGDQTKLALCPNSNEVHIYRKSGSSWSQECVLSEHGQRVLDMDWGAKRNRLVTCGEDRNAYVWTSEGGEWRPMLVLLRINRAATCVRWSPNEEKFAVGCGARLISICYFEVEQDWWVSKHIKKPIRSTVLSVDWHPNNYLVAAGSSDFKARVFSAYVKEIEEKPAPTPWGKKGTFGNLMAEFSNGGGGWVHSVSFSPSGNKLVWVGHDSSISVAVAGGDQVVTTIKQTHLPMLTCVFVSEKSIIAGGHDCSPYLFRHDDNAELTALQKLDVVKAKSAGTSSAMDKFRSLDKKGSTESTDSGRSASTHQNSIVDARMVGPKGAGKGISTAGVDGLVVVWNFKSLESSIAGLKIA